MAQARILDPMAIALKPVRADLLDQPIRREGGQIIQSRSQGFPNTFQVGKRTDACEYMRRIGALFASGFEPAALLAALQQYIQEQGLRLPCH